MKPSEKDKAMRLSRIVTLGLLSGATWLVPVSAQADNIYDVESARANARAGGPVSEYDAFLLERYGALSGTYGYKRYDHYDRSRRAHKKSWRRAARWHDRY
ncbi:MAG: hypothetical protein CTY31_03515 [Hyphomicrobium sp.]|nr:MAG: hypothetical protein CTY39_12345 [Hyphomicrobium sp.]PPD01813.1 MAG: hypothetical protein CTY31_03515 [Hyphomicrobium sp.]